MLDQGWQYGLLHTRTAVQGKVDVKFLSVSATERANAEGIVEGVRQIFEEKLKMKWDDIIPKVVGLACDGASVMLGCWNGVSAMLKAQQARMVTVHCMAHRLKLALKDSMKTVKMFDKCVNTFLLGIYLFYHKSTLNCSMLKRSYKALKADTEEEPKMPTRCGGTRWIGHLLNSIQNLIESYR